MLMSIATAAIIFGFCGAFHYWIMSGSTQFLKLKKLAPGTQLLLVLYAAGIAHTIEAIFYAFGFLFLEGLDLGGFSKSDQMSVMDTIYFSLVNYTSLGLGDIYPTGHLRFLAGIASLNGFLLIGCSASFLYLHMSAPKTVGKRESQ